MGTSSSYGCIAPILIWVYISLYCYKAPYMGVYLLILLQSSLYGHGYIAPCNMAYATWIHTTQFLKLWVCVAQTPD